jgi:predicted patatin/cPLA2 family phospholipase
MLFSASKKYISYKNIFSNKSIMDFERLYQDADKVFPIDFDRLKANLENKIFYVVVTDAVS